MLPERTRCPAPGRGKFPSRGGVDQTNRSLARALPGAMVPPRMKRLLVILFATCLGAHAEVKTSEVTYEGGKVLSRGFLALPEGEGPHPGVLVLHEWWGLNDYTRKRARMLAELGYAALAVDLFGEGRIAYDPQGGWRLMMPVLNHTPEMTSRFLGAMKCLQSQEAVDADKIAAIGYSFGGTVCLQMARNGIRGLDGVAAFHAQLKVRSPNPPVPRLSASILVCHGGEAVFDRPGLREAFTKELSSVEADLRFVEYPEAMDGFTNPDATRLGEKFRIPLKYSQSADEASWKELQDFLGSLWAEAPTGE